MSALKDLLFTIRQHPAFPELLKMVEVPPVKTYSPNKGEPQSQYAEFIFRSGQQRQQEKWLHALTESNPSQQEKS